MIFDIPDVSCLGAVTMSVNVTLSRLLLRISTAATLSRASLRVLNERCIIPWGSYPFLVNHKDLKPTARVFERSRFDNE